MSIYHCDDCRYLHSQCKCPDVGPMWYTNKTHEENVRMQQDWYRKNGKSHPYYNPDEDDR